MHSTLDSSAQQAFAALWGCDCQIAGTNHESCLTCFCIHNSGVPVRPPSLGKETEQVKVRTAMLEKFSLSDLKKSA